MNLCYNILYYIIISCSDIITLFYIILLYYHSGAKGWEVRIEIRTSLKSPMTRQEPEFLRIIDDNVFFMMGPQMRDLGVIPPAFDSEFRSASFLFHQNS